MKRAGQIPLLAAVALVTWLTGCATPRYGSPGALALDMDSVSSTTRHQPSLLLRTPGEEQLVNPSWLGRAAVAAGAAATVGVVTVVELSAQERQQLEEELQRCAQFAELAVNRRKLNQDGLPAPEDCYKVEAVDENGNNITLAMVLGDLKHQEALKCVEEQVAPRYPGRILIEPRYRYYEGADLTEYVSPEREAWLLEQRLHGELERSLFPDIVIIADGNPYRIQAIYDYKFPCTNPNRVPDWRIYSERSPFANFNQGEIYTKACKVAPKRITPLRIKK